MPHLFNFAQIKLETNKKKLTDDERTSAHVLAVSSENCLLSVQDAMITSNALIITEAIYYCSQVLNYRGEQT